MYHKTKAVMNGVSQNSAAAVDFVKLSLLKCLFITDFNKFTIDKSRKDISL